MNVLNENQIRFFLEKESGNVTAIFGWSVYQGSIYFDCITSLLPHMNASPVMGDVHEDYIKGCCNEIDRTEANKIHPALFNYINEINKEALSWI